MKTLDFGKLNFLESSTVIKPSRIISKASPSYIELKKRLQDLEDR